MVMMGHELDRRPWRQRVALACLLLLGWALPADWVGHSPESGCELFACCHAGRGSDTSLLADCLVTGDNHGACLACQLIRSLQTVTLTADVVVSAPALGATVAAPALEAVSLPSPTSGSPRSPPLL